MKMITQNRKNAKQQFEVLCGKEWLQKELGEVMLEGKKSLDRCVMELGKKLAETLMYMEREEVAGADYHPSRVEVKKWGSQRGSIYLGREKVRVVHPRLRGSQGEMDLKTYERLKNPNAFSEEMLVFAMRGLSARRYQETITDLGEHFGVSAGSTSARLIEVTSRKLQELLERDLSKFDGFAIFLDTVHRGGTAFVVGLGIDVRGQKQVLGFWEGTTENHEVVKSLLSDLESRGLKLHDEILFVSDGGSGIVKALRDRFGEDLIHQRCTIHKDRNLQRHLPKRYRREAHRRYRMALELKTYEDAKQGLQELKKWLSPINESAARSLEEALEEVLTLHRLEAGELLRKTLHSTNSIESVFSTVRFREKNIKNYQGSKMKQRWLATVLLHAEETFRVVKGHQEIPKIIENIKTQRNAKLEKLAA